MRVGCQAPGVAEAEASPLAKRADGILRAVARQLNASPSLGAHRTHALEATTLNPYISHTITCYFVFAESLYSQSSSSSADSSSSSASFYSSSSASFSSSPGVLFSSHSDSSLLSPEHAPFRVDRSGHPGHPPTEHRADPQPSHFGPSFSLCLVSS